MKYIRVENQCFDSGWKSVWYEDTPESRARLEAAALFRNACVRQDSYRVVDRDITVPVSPVRDHAFAIEYPAQSIDPSQDPTVVQTAKGNVYYEKLVVNQTNLIKRLEDGFIGVGVLYTDDPILDGGAYYAYKWGVNDKTTHTIQITGSGMLSRNGENEDPHLYRRMPVNHDRLYFTIDIVDCDAEEYSFTLGRNDTLVLNIDIRTSEEIDQLIAQGQLNTNKIISGK